MNNIELKEAKAILIRKAAANNKWRTRGGFVALKDMERRHLLNTVAFIKKKEDFKSNPVWEAWVSVINYELKTRKK